MNKPKTTIGVSRYTAFPITSDDGEGTVYGTPVPVPGTVEIAPTDTGSTNTFDADNGAYETDSYIEKMGHDITNADIPPEVENAWRGLGSSKYMVEVDRDSAGKAPDFGVAWMVTKHDGHFRLVRYYKGKYGFASNVGGKTKPSEGAPEHQTAKATFTAVFRDSDDKGYAYIDTANLPEGVTESTAIEKWFTDMNWCPDGTTVVSAKNEGE